MPTLVPLFVRRVSGQPDGAVIVVLLPPLTVIPATSTSSFATEAGLVITIVLAPEELFAACEATPALIVHPPLHGAELSATSWAAQLLLWVAVAALVPVAAAVACV